MKVLENASVFKLAFFITISIYFNNWYIYSLIFLFLFIQNRKESLFYIVLLIIALLLKIYKFDFIPIGVIIEKKNKYYIVNKLFYKVKLYTDESLSIGDIVLSYKFKINDYSDIKNNILFYGNNYKYLYTIKIKNFIYEYINGFDNELSSILIRQFYNFYQNNDDYYFNIGYGLTIYYILKYLSYKSNRLCLLFIFIYSIVFSFQIKFILIILDMVFKKSKSKNRVGYKILFFDLFYFHLLNNYSILLPLLISIYPYINIQMDFKLYISIIESFLFGEFNLLTNYLYKPFIIIRITYFCLCILVLLFPIFKNEFLFITGLYTKINDIRLFDIRGKLSISILLFILLIYKFINIKNNKLKYIFLVIYIISPIFNPYFSINFIDVGQGDAILIHDCLNLGNILIDTGSKYNYYKLKKSLISEGIYTLDYLIITHNDSDHSDNVENLSKDFNIKNIVYERKDIRLNNISLKNYDVGNFSNDNDNSLVYSLMINDTSFLFTGDISSDVERLLIKEYGPFNIDILKASHHGSNSGNSDYFISSIMPKYVIYSTSGQYNHPNKRVINTMDKYKVKQLSTKELGNIKFIFTSFIRVYKTSKGSVII